MSWVLGIDLGTSFTAAGVVSGTRLEPLHLGAHSSAIPSAVFTGDSGMVVGEAAIVRGDSSPTRLVLEFKRQLGDSSPILVGDQFVSAEALEGALGHWVFRRACELEGSSPSQVVFTFPAFWGAYRRDLFLGLVREIVEDPERVTLVTEPEAAAAFYASRDRLPVDTIVGVYDLGGGTFDASILKKTEDGFTVLGRPAGDDQLGGADLDRALLEYVSDRAGLRWDELDRTDPRMARDMLHLRRNVIVAKELLSEELSTEVGMSIGSIDTTVLLTRRELEQLAEPMIARTIEVFETALAYASISARDLHSILLVGAASRMPRIAEALGDHFRVPLALDSHPKFAICLGAAISSSVPARSGLAPPPGQPLPPPRPPADQAGARGSGQSGGWVRRHVALVVIGIVVALLAVGAGVFVAVGGGSSEPSYRATVLAAHPWGYWRLDERTGDRVVDSSANNTGGTTKGTLAHGVGGVVAGNAATAFDGATGCAVIGTKVNPSTFSLEAWFKTTTTKGGPIIAFNAGPDAVAVAEPAGNVDHDRHVYMRDDGRVSFGVNHAQSIETTNGSYNDGNWHQVVAVIGPAGQKLYIDGQLAMTSPNTTVETYDGYWHIGCSGLQFWPDKPTSDYFNGTIDEAAVYTTELAPATVADHFRAVSPGS